MGNKDGEAKSGFGGLSSLGSKVDLAELETTAATDRVAKERTGATQRPAASPARPVPPTPDRAAATGFSVPKQPFRLPRGLLLGIGALVVLAIIIGLNSNDTSSPSTVNTSVPYTPPVARSADITEVMPTIGGADRLLSRNEIAYCLSEDVRLSAAKESMDRYRNDLIDRFNSAVNFFNAACGRYKYHQRDFDAAEAYVGARRNALRSEGQSQYAR